MYTKTYIKIFKDQDKYFSDNITIKNVLLQ